MLVLTVFVAELLLRTEAEKVDQPEDTDKDKDKDKEKDQPKDEDKDKDSYCG